MTWSTVRALCATGRASKGGGIVTDWLPWAAAEGRGVRAQVGFYLTSLKHADNLTLTFRRAGSLRFRDTWTTLINVAYVVGILASLSFQPSNPVAERPAFRTTLVRG